MLKTLREFLRTGNATTLYPFAPIEQAKDVRGKPEHDPVLCLACAACAVACPPNAIQMETDLDSGTITWSINYGRCIFCGRCEEVCPLGAISLSPEFELAVTAKSDLTDSSTYALARCAQCGCFFAPRKEVEYVKSLIGLIDGPHADSKASDLCQTCKRLYDALALHARDARG